MTTSTKEIIKKKFLNWKIRSENILNISQIKKFCKMRIMKWELMNHQSFQMRKMKDLACNSLEKIIFNNTLAI